MNELQRWQAVVRFERPDYWPLVTTGGLGYIHGGGLKKLHAEGLPAEVDDIEKWCRYWGQCTFDHIGGCGVDYPEVKSERWTEGDFEFVRTETGALTRQVLPDVRSRDSGDGRISRDMPVLHASARNLR